MKMIENWVCKCSSHMHKNSVQNFMLNSISNNLFPLSDFPFTLLSELTQTATYTFVLDCLKLGC